MAAIKISLALSLMKTGKIGSLFFIAISCAPSLNSAMAESVLFLVPSGKIYIEFPLFTDAFMSLKNHPFEMIHGLVILFQDFL